MTICKCGGWGVQSAQSYHVAPCGPRCVNSEIIDALENADLSHLRPYPQNHYDIALRHAYNHVLTERIPDDMRRLIEGLR